MGSLSQCQSSCSHAQSGGYLELAILFSGAVRPYPIFFLKTLQRILLSCSLNFIRPVESLLCCFCILPSNIFLQVDLTEISCYTLSNLDLSSLPHSNLQPLYARYYDQSSQLKKLRLKRA